MKATRSAEGVYLAQEQAAAPALPAPGPSVQRLALAALQLPRTFSGRSMVSTVPWITSMTSENWGVARVGEAGRSGRGWRGEV